MLLRSIHTSRLVDTNPAKKRIVEDILVQGYAYSCAFRTIGRLKSKNQINGKDPARGEPAAPCYEVYSSCFLIALSMPEKISA